MNLQGQTAIVTGAGRGIGRAIAVELASLGANVIVNYAGNEAAALETVKLCGEEYEKQSFQAEIDHVKGNITNETMTEANRVKAIAVKANVADCKECEVLMQTAMDNFGAVDILVNNAGITRDKLMMAMKEEDFSEVIDVNLKGTFYCMKLASKIMMKQRYGRIINLSSIVGLRGNAGQANYAASKAGVIGLTKSAAKELASRNITVNAVAPGMIETDMTNVLPEKVKEAMLNEIPAKRAGTPEDVAKAVAFFAAKEAEYITGQVLCVDGGMAV